MKRNPVKEDQRGFNLWNRAGLTKGEGVANKTFVSLSHAADQKDKHLIGNTGFFRHIPLYREALNWAVELNAFDGRMVTLLCAAGSIGAEAYSLAYLARDHKWLRVQTLDLSTMYTEIAQNAVYPAVMAQTLPEEIQSVMFEPFGHKFVKIRDVFRRKVDVLKPQSIVDLEHSGVAADITITAKTLMHITDEPDRSAAIRGLAKVSSYALFTDCDLTGRMPAPFVKAIADAGRYQAWRNPARLG